MNRFNVILRDPALLLDTLETGLVLLVALGMPLSHDQTTYIVAVVIALIGIAKGAATHPFPVHLIVDLSRAALVLAASFGLNLPPDKIAIIVTFIGTLTSLVGSIRTTPSYDAITRPGGAGAGPVTTRTEAGYGDPFYLLSVVLIIGGVLVLIFWHALFLALVLIVLGIILGCVPTYRGRRGGL